jgi:hypothetical protein
MASPKKERKDDVPKTKVLGAPDPADAETAEGKDTGNAGGSASTASGPRKPPPNARVVKPSYKTGTISRAAARAAIKELQESGEMS